MPLMFFMSSLVLAAATLIAPTPDPPETLSPEPARQLVRSIYAELVASNTSYTTGQTTPAAEAMAKRLPRYPTVPVARLGRLAVDGEYRGQKLGAALLWDAAARAARSEMAVFALLVDAKDDQAEAFYRHPGFVPFGSATRQLVLPVATFAADVRRSVASARACRKPFHNAIRDKAPVRESSPMDVR